MGSTLQSPPEHSVPFKGCPFHLPHQAWSRTTSMLDIAPAGYSPSDHRQHCLFESVPLIHLLLGRGAGASYILFSLPLLPMNHREAPLQGGHSRPQVCGPPRAVPTHSLTLGLGQGSLAVSYPQQRRELGP